MISDEDLDRFAKSDKLSRRAGLYLTIIFHLVLVIILLIVSISTVRKGEISFVTDSEGQIAKSRQEEEERLQEEIKAIAKAQLEDQIAGRPVTTYRAVAVSRNTQLKDDRNTDADKLYKDAEDLQQRIKDAAKIQTDGVDEVPSAAKYEEKKEETPAYKGPSVLYWILEGRRAFSLPIPVYKCRGGGDVTIQIYVGKNGYVQRAQVVADASVPDECIRNAALNAAKRSRFSSSDTAPDPQLGQITYRFIAQ
ncbi:MAG: energy transducer TonB [Bacteroidales bacterium]|nr:energy transducer TonB [Bacteroidales bacterium]